MTTDNVTTERQDRTGTSYRVECFEPEQAITLWLGTGAPVSFDDSVSRADVDRELRISPVQRAVIVARLRALADLIEKPPPLYAVLGAARSSQSGDEVDIARIEAGVVSS